MKKAFLSIIALSFFGLFQINAQTSQGKFLLGSSTSIGFFGTVNEFMNIGFTSVKDKSDNSTNDDADKVISFNLQPKAGYFVIDNLAVGVDLFCYFQAYKSNSGSTDYKSSSTLFTAGPFVRYYIPTSKVMPYFEAGGSMGTFINKDDYSGDEDEIRKRVISATGRAGVAIPLGEIVLFEASILYNYMNMKDTEDNDSNYRTIYSTFGINIGFIVLL